MANASERGWPVNPATVRVPCPGIPLNLHPAVAPLFAELIRRVDAIKGPGFMTSSGGKNVRPVRGYEARYAQTKSVSLLSNHSWGLAADFRAATNPMSTVLKTDMPSNISQIAADCGLEWGGDYKGRKDGMHFEFVGTPAQAAAAVARLNASKNQPAAAHADEEELANMDVFNPYANGGKGGSEPAAQAIGYMEQRTSDRTTSVIIAHLQSDAFLDAVAARVTRNLMAAPVNNVLTVKDDGTEERQNIEVARAFARSAEAPVNYRRAARS